MIDSETGSLVVRVAYDGSPLAGKTETLRCLGRLLDQRVESLDEAYGRTLWFDWMRYDGGMYDGAPIECEVVALPGQTALEPRRRVLLAAADTVVFVADCSPAGHDGTRTAIARYRTWSASREVTPQLVVQANKRDLPDAWGVEELRDELELAEHVPVVESVATDASGVRRAFILAVGRAVRRAEAQRLATGQLPRGEGPRTSAQLRDRVQGNPPPAPDGARRAIGPRLPTPGMPPVDRSSDGPRARKLREVTW